MQSPAWHVGIGIPLLSQIVFLVVELSRLRAQQTLHDHVSMMVNFNLCREDLKVHAAFSELLYSRPFLYLVHIDSNDRTSDMGDSFSPSVSSLSLSSDDPFTNSQDSGARNILSDDEVETPRWLQDVRSVVVKVLKIAKRKEFESEICFCMFLGL